MKQFVFYDLDGTTVDTRQDIVNAANHMVFEISGKTLSNDEVYRFVGRGIRFLIEGCLDATDDQTVEKGLGIYRKHYREHMLDCTKLYPGTINLLKRYEGVKQAIVTNKPDPYSTQILEALRVKDFFCAIVPGNSEEFPKKPDPTSVLGLLERFKISKDEALFVGDSHVDFETGVNAGVDTVLVSHGFSSYEDLEKLKPNYLFHDLTQVQKFLDEKGW